MGIKYFFNLWGRNIKGTFWGGFRIADSVLRSNEGTGALVTFLLHIVTLPVTITIGAILKTLFDFFSRKALPARQIFQTRRDIKHMEQEKFDAFTERLASYPAKSASSKQVLQQLNTLRDEAESTFQEKSRTKKDRLALEQLGQPCALLRMTDDPNTYTMHELREHYGQLNLIILHDNRLYCADNKSNMLKELTPGNDERRNQSLETLKAKFNCCLITRNSHAAGARYLYCDDRALYIDAQGNRQEFSEMEPQAKRAYKKMFPRLATDLTPHDASDADLERIYKLTRHRHPVLVDRLIQPTRAALELIRYVKDADMLTDEPLLKHSIEHITSLPLDKEHEQTLTEYKEMRARRLTFTRVYEQKKVVRDFAGAEHNNGKELLRKMSLFAAEAKSADIPFDPPRASSERCL